ncbi:hypothetical protein B5F35_16365 [Anaeromassilibacillus sp. An200]|nr:hypothetical protein B5F35_16365 [Anaeromassilibacillus sp. An200]
MILHKVPPKRDYGRYFCILAEKRGSSQNGYQARQGNSARAGENVCSPGGRKKGGTAGKEPAGFRL